MAGQTRALLTAKVFVFAIPAAALAQAPAPGTAAFDGHYKGVSAHIEKSTGRGRQCPRMHTPDALTITSGTVQSSGRDEWTGP
jgi:hypothetical protein